MRKRKYHVIGVMSGTSLDGIDVAECFFEISETQKWSFTIGVSETIEYPADLEENIAGSSTIFRRKTY